MSTASDFRNPQRLDQRSRRSGEINAQGFAETMLAEPTDGLSAIESDGWGLDAYASGATALTGATGAVASLSGIVLLRAGLTGAITATSDAFYVAPQPSSVLTGTTQYGTDYLERTGAPSGGVLVSAWAHIPEMGAPPWSHPNQDVFYIFGSAGGDRSWRIQCLTNNCGADDTVNPTCRFNANTMVFGHRADPNWKDTYVADYTYFGENTSTYLQVTEWTWCAWWIRVLSDRFELVQYFRRNSGDTTMVTRSSTVMFADCRTALLADGWDSTAAAAWTPTDVTDFTIGNSSSPGYITLARVYAQSTEPSAYFLGTISTSEAPIEDTWANYPLTWSGGAANTNDTSGNGRNLSIVAGGTLYEGIPGPTAASFLVSSPVTGTAGATGTLTGSAKASASVTGSAAATGTPSGTISARASRTGTAGATSTNAGTDSARASVAGTSAATGTCGATPLARATLTGTSAATGTPSGPALARASVTGSSAATGTCSGAPLAHAAVTGGAASTGTAAAAQSGRASISGTSAATGTLVGSVSNGTAPAGTITGSAAATSTLTGTDSARASLTGTSSGVGTCMATPKAKAGLSGSSAATGAASGVMSARASRTGSAAATSSLTGTATPGLRLSGTAGASSGLTGSVLASAGMAGEATGTGALTGTLVAAAGLTGSAESTSVLDARLHDGTNRVLPPLSRTAQALVEIPDRTAVEAIVRARISYVEVTAREALADYSPHTPIVRIAA